MDKWDYIEKISSQSTIGNDLLLKLMDKYNKINIAEITCSEAREFYESLKRRKFYENC